jgi:hypothetical protein
MRSLILVFPAALLTIALVGCGGTEVGRIPFAEIGEGETEVVIDASKEVDFWTELDFKKEEDVSLAQSIMADKDVSLAYSVVLIQGGNVVKRLTCDPFDISSFALSTKFTSFDTSLRTTRSFKYKGKMRCSVNLPNTGSTVVEAILAPVNTNDGSIANLPGSFKLSRANLVIKQR